MLHFLKPFYSKFSVLLITSSLIAGVFLSAYIPIAESNYAVLLNLVEQQSLLTEQIFSLTLQSTRPTPLEQNKSRLQSELDQSIARYDNRLLAFVNGAEIRDNLDNSVEFSTIQQSPDVQELLKQAQTTWAAYRTQIQAVLNSPHQNDDRELQTLLSLKVQQAELMVQLTSTIDISTTTTLQGIRHIRNGSFAILLIFAPILWKRHLAQQQQQQLINLYERCLAKANDIVIITEASPIDLPGPRIVYVNEAFVRTTGYSREEAIGNNPRMLQGEKTDRATLDAIRKALSKWQPIRCEVINYTKSGEEFWLELDITPIADESGWFTHWLCVQRDITAKKALEQSFDNLTERYQVIFDAMPVLIGYWDTHLLNCFSNQAHLDWFGVDPKDLQGMHAKDMLGETIYQLDHCYHEGVLRGEKQRFERRLFSRDGHYRDAIIEFIPHIHDKEVMGFYAIAFDVTDLKEAQVAANASKQKLQKLYDLSPLGIALVDMQGRFLEFNAQFEELTGYPSDELFHLDYRQLTPEKYKDQEAQQLVLLQTTGRYGPYEKEYRQKDGALIPVVLNGVKITDDEGNEYIWSIAEEITERRKNEQQLVKLKEAAEALAQAKSDFLANMSHEIRTPMNAIMGFCQLLLYKDNPPEVRDYLEKIATASNGLMSIVNDVLDFSKLDTGRLSLTVIWFELDTLISNLNTLFAEAAIQKGLVFEVYRDSQIPNNLKGDSVHIQQVLAHLISNAIKFTEKGKVTLSIDLLSSEHEGANILFSVQDSGIGIAKEQQSKLFHSFTQADNSSTRRYGGTGLGLAICTRLLQLMHSQFELTSAVGLGSKFSFELLLIAKTQPKKPPVQAAVSPDTIPATLSGHILVVEDTYLNQVVIAKFLNLSGLTVDIANNGNEALDMLTKNHYDVVLMDIHMPVMNGIEATEKIRSQAQFANLPIIALTAGVTDEERENCFNAGMNAFISKPFKPKEILATLAEWLT